MPELENYFRNLVTRRAKQAEDYLGNVVRGTAEEIMSRAQGTVPQESGILQETAVVRGPVHSGHSVAASAGYDAPYAAAEHEGFHGGYRVKGDPPQWLLKATEAQDAAEFQMQVYSALVAALKE